MIELRAALRRENGGGPWTPALPEPAAAGELAWQQVELASACTNGPPPAGNGAAPLVITTEAAFQAAYCRSSTLDWSRWRLVAIPHTDDVVVRMVVRDVPYVRVFLHSQPACETNWGGLLHLLLPAETAPVVVARERGPAPQCPEGYGY